MLKKTIKYTDFNGVEQTDDLYFHISKTSALTATDEIYNDVINLGKELQAEAKILETMDGEPNFDDPLSEESQFFAKTVRNLAKLIDRLIDMAYGRRSEDGKRFIRSKEVLNEFKSSAVYEAFVGYMKENLVWQVWARDEFGNKTVLLPAGGYFVSQ